MAYKRNSPTPVVEGGTGAQTLTGVLTGNGTSAITANAVTNGAVLLGGASNAVTDTGVLSKGTLIVGDGSGAPTLLTVGSNDTVLIADSAESSGLKWGTASGGSGSFEFISSATAASDSSIEFTDLSSTYFAYRFDFIHVAPAVDGQNFRMRVSTDNGSTYIFTSSYLWNRTNFDTSISTSGTGVIPATYMEISGPVGTSINEFIDSVVFLYNPSSSIKTKVTGQTMYKSTANSPVSVVSHGDAGIGAVNAVRFLFGVGNIASGVIKLYGIKAA